MEQNKNKFEDVRFSTYSLYEKYNGIYIAIFFLQEFLAYFHLQYIFMKGVLELLMNWFPCLGYHFHYSLYWTG